VYGEERPKSCLTRLIGTGGVYPLVAGFQIRVAEIDLLSICPRSSP
jgi:hypothetical protein